MDPKRVGQAPADDNEHASPAVDQTKAVQERAARQDSNADPRQDSNGQAANIPLPAAAQPTAVQPGTVEAAHARPPSDDAASSTRQDSTAIPERQDASTRQDSGAIPDRQVQEDGEPAPRPSEEIEIVTGQRISPQQSLERLRSHPESEVTGRVPPEDSPPDSDVDEIVPATVLRATAAPIPVPDDENRERWERAMIEQMRIATRQRELAQEQRREDPAPPSQTAPVWRNTFGGGARASANLPHVQDAPVWRNAFGGSARTSDVYRGQENASQVNGRSGMDAQRENRPSTSRRVSDEVGPSGERTDSVDYRAVANSKNALRLLLQTREQRRRAAQNGFEDNIRRALARTDSAGPAEQTVQHRDSSTNCTTSPSQLRPDAPTFEPGMTASQPPAQPGHPDSQPLSPLNDGEDCLVGNDRRRRRSSTARDVYFWDEMQFDDVGEGPSKREFTRITRERSQSELETPIHTNGHLPRDDIGPYWINPTTGTK